MQSLDTESWGSSARVTGWWWAFPPSEAATLIIDKKSILTSDMRKQAQTSLESI